MWSCYLWLKCCCLRQLAVACYKSFQNNWETFVCLCGPSAWLQMLTMPNAVLSIHMRSGMPWQDNVAIALPLAALHSAKFNYDVQGETMVESLHGAGCYVSTYHSTSFRLHCILGCIHMWRTQVCWCIKHSDHKETVLHIHLRLQTEDWTFRILGQSCYVGQLTNLPHQDNTVSCEGLAYTESVQLICTRCRQPTL